MKITIHRGANQIGGCVTEIASGNTKILIDLGSNLPGQVNHEFTPEEVGNICKGVSAVFYTHYHGDHIGLMRWVPSHCDQYIGQGAIEVLLCKQKFLKQPGISDVLQNIKTFHLAQPIRVGHAENFVVTPYLVSHSAFDSYMFKIECDGKVILHTGDFRRHGYLGKGLFPTLERYIGNVDLLIIEGTMLGRRNEIVQSENEIKQNTIRFLKEHKYVYALCSSTDMDRLASFHSACKITGRKFYVDSYQKQVLDVFSKYSGPHSDLFKFDSLFVPDNYRDPKVHQNLAVSGFLRLVRTHHFHLIDKMMHEFNDNESWLIYSMWNGYAEKGKSYSSEDILKIRSLFGERIADGSKDGFHTSGHADLNTLRKVCQLVHPRYGIIPIHKESASDPRLLTTHSDIKIFERGITYLDGIVIDIK